MALITCKNLSFAYENMTVAKNINFCVEKSDYVCIVGENGSGKSTLIKGLLGLKSPHGGTIKFSDGLKSNEIGYLPQQTAAQRDFPASVYEVVLSGCLSSRGFRPFYSKKDKQSALNNIQRLGIESIIHRCYRELSGGQQQRVLLARALCAGKKMLLLDEPVTGLDPIATDDMYRLIQSLNNKEGIAVIMVSHDIHAAVKYAAHILHLSAENSFFGTTLEYLNSSMGEYFFRREKHGWT